MTSIFIFQTKMAEQTQWHFVCDRKHVQGAPILIETRTQGVATRAEYGPDISAKTEHDTLTFEIGKKCCKVEGHLSLPEIIKKILILEVLEDNHISYICQVEDGGAKVTPYGESSIYNFQWTICGKYRTMLFTLHF